MFKLISTDRDWELMAQGEPFFAVLTWDKFFRRNLTPEVLHEFFASGEEYVGKLFETIRARIDPKFAPERSLDFGCGVGRLVGALARRSGSVVGVDVADSMLREARRHLDAAGVTNAQLVKGDDALSSVEGPFDLVHSFIVFQHIPVARGEKLFRELLARMKEGSVGALHFTYAHDSEPIRPGFWWRVKRAWTRFRSALRTLRGIGQMQMNSYNLNVLFRVLQEHGVRRTHVEFTKHGESFGVLLLFQKRDGGGFA